MNYKKLDAIIVGAGVTGSYLSYKLREHGLKVLMVEKSRGIGGRLCTKFVGGELVDYGCQYMRPKSCELKLLLSTLEQKNIVKKIKTDSKKVYIAPYGMNRIPQYLSLGTPVLTNSLVKFLEYKNNRWIIHSESFSFESKMVILTMPVKQVETLIKMSELPMLDLPVAKYMEFLTATFQGKRGKKIFDHSKLLPWICNNKRKGLQNQSDVFTVNFFNQMSLKLQNLNKKERLAKSKQLLMDEGFKDVKNLNLHYWKYAYTSNQNNIDHVFNTDMKLGVCGDSFSIGKVDGAIKSSNKVYQKMLSTF